MSKIVSSILTLFLLGGTVVSSSVSAEEDDLSTYEAYQKQVGNICKIPDSKFWIEADEHPILSTKILYPKIGDEEANKNLIESSKKYLSYTSTEDDGRTFEQSYSLDTIETQLEMAKKIYDARMNTIFACAVLDAKTRTAEKLKTAMGDGQKSEITNEMQKQVDRNEMLGDARGCREIKADNENSIQKIVLDNAMYEYCNYRVYLTHLDQYNRNDISGKFQKDQKEFPKMRTEWLLFELKRTSSLVNKESAHAKEVFPKALAAFAEFEKNYPSHIVLTYILDDYIKIRKDLRAIMNPLSQVFYKASNAQKQ